MKTQTGSHPASAGAGTVEPGLHRKLGLTDSELERIHQILGRAPNRAELAMYSVMWSEHCSYKSSRMHLKSLPSEGPRVLVGPGEGAGMIEVDGLAVALRIESHNHPSFVEPVQGAATGIGGVVRDVLSMGARPIALLDSLRFGPLPGDGTASEGAEVNRFLVEGVVSGISSYGNCIGVPTVGGEIKFDPSYSGNPLVNVMCLGVAPAGRIVLARAHGPGNAVLLLGSSTGRDGIGGVSVLASASFDEDASAKRPSVQVGDPFTEKMLIEACLSLIEKGLVVGVQDLGGAGLCCATSESAAAANTGIRIDLDAVPLREPSMQPFEVLTSESQERMLVIVRPEHVEACLKECDRMGLRAAHIGEVTDTGRLEVVHSGGLAADVPAASLGDGPLYDRPANRPSLIRPGTAQAPAPAPDPGALLVRLLASPNIGSKRWAWEQYDHQVMLGTVTEPGHDAAVLRLPGSKWRVAVTTDGNGRYCSIDPYLGTQHSVAEAARNLSVVGAEPAAITNCLNFGNPERPEVMWQFIEAVKGLGDAARAMGIPVAGGNVSFYNETAGDSIHPTPVIGMVGVLPPGVRTPPLGFQQSGDLVLVAGATGPDLGGSEYIEAAGGPAQEEIPPLDLGAEVAVQALVRRAIVEGLLSSSHDCSAGGLGVALARCCIEGGIGSTIKPDPALSSHEWLFSETPSRILLSCPPSAHELLAKLAKNAGVDLSSLGTVGGGELVIEGVADIPVDRLSEAYESGFASRLGAPVQPVAAGHFDEPSRRDTVRETM